MYNEDAITCSGFIAKTITHTLVPIESSSGLYWTQLLRSSFTGHNYSLMIIICISIIEIKSSVQDLYPKQYFCIVAYFTLSFDLLTLTLGNSITHEYKSHVLHYQSPTINLSFKGENTPKKHTH